MELFLHKGVSTHSAGKYTMSLRDMTKMLHLGVAKPRLGGIPHLRFRS